MRPPFVKPPGRGQGRNVPKGYILGRVSPGRGPVELVDARVAGQLGLASRTDAVNIANAAVSAAGGSDEYVTLSLGVEPGQAVTDGNGNFIRVGYSP